MAAALGAAALAALGWGLPGWVSLDGGRTAEAASGTAPNVTVDVPLTNSQFCTCLRGTITLGATASASSGRTITGLVFQRSPAGAATWTTIGTSTSAPYSTSFDTTTVPAGSYDVRAVATDSAGESQASATARDRVVANNATFVALDDPGAVLHGTVELSATPEDGGNFPSTVTFQRSPAGAESWKTIAKADPEVDGDGLQTGRFVVKVDTTTLSDGPYDLRVVAVDDSADAFVARPRRDRLVDNTAPVATLSDPGATLSGSVTLAASAQDAGSGVASVRFERSPAGADAWSAFGAQTQPPYAQRLDTRMLEDGRYDLRVVAVDRAGNKATSAVVPGIEISNPGRARFDQLSIENVVAPAHRISLLGAIAGSSQHETWAYGFTDAPPASVDGERLPYTAPGDNQLVLLRYTDAGGWQVADVLRKPDGSPFPQLAGSELRQGGLKVIGEMTPSGEAWIAVGQPPRSGPSPDVALFHREPGHRFVLDPAATGALRPMLKRGLDGGDLRLGQTAGGRAYGLVLAPNQPSRQMSAPSSNGPVTVFGQLDYGALIDGAWSLRTASLPPSYEPVPNDGVALFAADATGPGTGWGAVSRTNPQRLMLGRFDGDQWSFSPTGLDALDLTDDFSDASLQTTDLAMRADGDGVWLGARISSGKVVARVDASSARVTESWCTPTLPHASAGCGAPLDANLSAAAVPDRVFDTPDGKVALALQRDFLDVYSHGDWTTVAAPGFTPTAGRPLFTGPDTGWLAGANALGRITGRPAPSTLAHWPQSNRSPLLSVALPRGSSGGVGGSGALAVGLDGTALHYDAASGWLVDPTPSRARRVALRGVAFSGPSTAFAVGQLGTILRWDGSSWSEDPQSVSATQSQLNAVAFGSDGDGWAVGAQGTILHFDGRSWSQERPPAADDGANITSVTVAGSDVFAVAAGDLITRSAGGTWKPVDPSLLPTAPAPAPGDLRLVSGLPDGGLVAAGRSVVMVRQHPNAQFEYSSQPLEGVAVALAAFRDEGGAVRAFVSLAPTIIEDGVDTHDIGGFPAGDGELMRQTSAGWQDLSRGQYPGRGTGGDGAVKTDPVLGVATGGSGTGAWVVGGYAGTVTAARLGTNAILPARPAGWRTSAIWRYDTGGSTPSPALAQAQVSLPAKSNTVSFAFFSSSLCRSQCAAVRDAQPDVNLRAAATQIGAFAAEPGGPAFAVLGGNARGPILESDYSAGNGALDFAHLPDILSPLRRIPLYAAYGPRDAVPTHANPAAPWAEAFAQAPAPFGSGRAPDGIQPAGSGEPTGAVHRYYAFDAAQNGGVLRVIVLDNSQGSLEDSAPGQSAWLDRCLAEAQSAGTPVVVVAARPLRSSVFGSASDADELATKLAGSGVLGVFTTSGSAWTSQVNRRGLVPENAEAGAPQIPEYEGATLGYQQPQNNGVLWYSVSVDTASRTLDVKAIPVVDSLAIKPLAGLTVARSSTLSFEAVGRRPAGSLATPPNDDGFPGFDNYVGIPSASCPTCVGPSYRFSSSDPTIGDFVVPSGPGSRFPKLDAKGHPIASSTSGLFCGFNSGATTISVTSGLLSSSLPVTVQEGDIGRPCGTVFRAGVGRVVVIPRQNQVRDTPSPSGSGAPPPPPPAAAPISGALPKVSLPPPPHAPAQAPAPAPKPVPHVQPAAPAPAAAPAAPQPVAVPAIPAVAVPPIPPAVTPVPPGGATASAQAAARRKEKAQKHASQSAYATRPAGTAGPDWFYPAVGLVSVLAALLAAGGMRPGPRARPAMLVDRGREIPPRRRNGWRS